MNILLTESQLKKITEILVGADADKIANINKFLEEFRDYERRELIFLKTYSSVPKKFRSGEIFGPIVYKHYTKKGGRFFFISTGLKKYIILLINDKLMGINSKGEQVNIERLEKIMDVDKWGLSLIDILRHTINN